jgi:hypothetical protein
VSATSQRDRVAQLAKTDFNEALLQSRKISEPWYRAQALAWVARYAPKDKILSTAQEAIKEAFTSQDAYQRVGASTWAIRALCERGHFQEASQLTTRLLNEAEKIAHPVCRLDALFLLWQGAELLPNEQNESILQRLIDACFAAQSWKGKWVLRNVVAILNDQDSERAYCIVSSLPEGRGKHYALRVLEKNGRLKPRPFVW